MSAMQARRSTPARRFWPSLVALAICGLALRLVYALALTPHLRGLGDSSWYHRIANLIADGRGFVSPDNATATALHPPLFPLLLAVASALGLKSYLAQRAASCIVGAAAILAIGVLGRRIGGERAGLLAATLAVIYPVMISSDAAVMPETLLGLLVALTALAAYRLADRPSVPRAAALGALIALAALARGEALALVVLLALPVCLRLRTRRAPCLAATCLTCALVIAPWEVRNATTFVRLVPLSTNEGTLIAGANCHSTYHGSAIGSWDLRCVPVSRGQDESVVAVDLRRDGLRYVRTHAGQLPVVLVARLARTFEVLQPIRQARHAEGRAAGIEVAGAFAFYAVALSAVVGAVTLRRRGAKMLPLVALVALAAVATLIGYGVPRFRQPADVALVVLAAAGAAPAGSTIASPATAWRRRPRTRRLSRSAGRSIA